MAARSKRDTPEKPSSAVIRTLDATVVVIIRLFIAMAMIKSRDPGESLTNLFRPDWEQQTRICGWQALLDWPNRLVSAYASMHPWEDFAETWARYLAMVSTLDTARHAVFDSEIDPAGDPLDTLITRYRNLGVSLNEINRSMGLIDAAPEVFVPVVVEKLRYVERLVRDGREITLR